jgi:shikimate kinase
MTNQKIIIVGFMGSGKSTVAAALGRQLNLAVIDLDDAVAEAEGRTPGELIEQKGEPAFRDVETKRLREVLGQDARAVIALGGGAWTIAENRELIAQQNAAITVWLDAPFELCWDRITTTTTAKRPLAQTMAAGEQLYRKRQADYALADKTIRVSENDSAETLAEKIAALCGHQPTN